MKCHEQGNEGLNKSQRPHATAETKRSNTIQKIVLRINHMALNSSILNLMIQRFGTTQMNFCTTFEISLARICILP